MPELLPAPYPADTRAKGWRFEIDYEKVAQSNTWSLAAEIPMAQPALLMMWLAAWTQEPCGSLPNDEDVIRAKCRIPVKQWPALRGILMRGWWLADDGRLYHQTITARVLEMLEYRRKNAERVANFKARQRESREGNALPTQQGGDSNDTGTGTGTTSSLRSDETPKAPRKRRAAAAEQQLVSVGDLVTEGVDQQHASDWLLLRKGKKLPLTPTAWDEVKTQAMAAGLPIGEAVRLAAVNGWGGFKAMWLADRQGGGRVVPMPNRQEALEQSNREIAARWAAQGTHHEPV